MTVSGMPTWEGFVVPVLRILSDGRSRSRRDLIGATSESLHLSGDERLETLTSGQLRFENRAGWAIQELFKAGALTRPQRATYVINDLGLSLLADHPESYRVMTC